MYYSESGSGRKENNTVSDTELGTEKSGVL